MTKAEKAAIRREAQALMAAAKALLLSPDGEDAGLHVNDADAALQRLRKARHAARRRAQHEAAQDARAPAG